MKIIILLASLSALISCTDYKAQELTLDGIENSYLLDDKNISSTKAFEDDQQKLCGALTLDSNQKPKRIRGFVISKDREIAPLYFDPEDVDKFETRNYIGIVEKSGEITSYENDTILLIKLQRNTEGELILTHGYLNETTVLESISLAKVQEVRGIIQKCKAQ